MFDPFGGLIPGTAVMAALVAALAGRQTAGWLILGASNAGILLSVFGGNVPAWMAAATYLGADLLGAAVLLADARRREAGLENEKKASELEARLAQITEENTRIHENNERGDRSVAGRKQIYQVSRRLAAILDLGDLPREIGKCIGMFFQLRRGELVLLGKDNGGYRTVQAFDIRSGAGIYADPQLMAEMEAEGLSGRFGVPKPASDSSRLLPVQAAEGEPEEERESIGLRCALGAGDVALAIYREAAEGKPLGVEGATANFASLPFFFRGSLAGLVALWDLKGKSEMAGLSAAEAEGALLALSQPFELAFQKCLLYREVERLSRTDPVTEVYKRGFFRSRVQEELERSRQVGGHLSLVMLDIDHFKDYNDRYGHQVGDAVLKRVASFLKGNIRAQDLASRFGGEEFLIGLVQTGREGAVQVAERIRKAVEGFEFDAGGIKTGITVSLGVATFPEHSQTLDDLISKADAALYRAKREGRNRTVVAE